MTMVLHDTATSMENFFGNQAEYMVPSSLLFKVFFNSWVYSNPFTTDILEIINVDANPSVLEQALAANGFGAGFTTGLGWSGKGIGLGLVLSMDVYGSGTNIGDTQGLVQGKLSGILGYSLLLINTQTVHLTLGADVRPYIRFLGQVGGSDFVSFTAVLAGKSTDPFLAVPVYVGASAELNAGALLDLNKIIKIGITAHELTTQQVFEETTIGLLFLSFSAAETGAVKEFYSMPLLALGAKVDVLSLLGVTGSTEVFVTVQLNDMINAFSAHDLLYEYVGCGLSLSVFNGLLKASAGYSYNSFSFGLTVRAWIMSLEAALFTVLQGHNPVQGFSAGVTIRF